MASAARSSKTDQAFCKEKLEDLFWAYFNNKMTVLLMVIEHPAIASSVLKPEKQKIFLQDIYHHFLSSRADRKYHRAFRWLNCFFDRYPDIGCKQIYRAIRMVGLIYEAFGRKLNPRLEAIRLERES